MIPARNVLLPWVLLALVMLAGGLYLWLVPPKIVYQSKPGPVQKAPPPKKVLDIRRELVPVHAQIEFFPKKELAEKLKMPEIETMYDNVIAVGEVPIHTGKTTVLGTLSLGTDNVYRGGLLFRQEPTRFWELKKEFGAEAWYNVTGPQKMEGYIMANPLRTGPVEWKAKGGVVVGRDSSEVEAVVGIGLQYRF